VSVVRPDVPLDLARALDAALEPLAKNRTISSAELAEVLERASSPGAEQELRWAMEIYRALATMDDTVRPLESMPPSTPVAQPCFPAPAQPGNDADSGSEPKPLAIDLPIVVAASTRDEPGSEPKPLASDPLVAVPSDPRGDPVSEPRALAVDLPKAAPSGPRSNRKRPRPVRAALPREAPQRDLAPQPAARAAPEQGPDASSSCVAPPQARTAPMSARAAKPHARQRLSNNLIVAAVAVIGVAAFALAFGGRSRGPGLSSTPAPLSSKETATAPAGADLPPSLPVLPKSPDAQHAPVDGVASSAASTRPARSSTAPDPLRESAAAPAALPMASEDGSLLSERDGYLVVHFSADSPTAPHVYVSGVPLGPVETRLRVPCGITHVRVGTFPQHRWLSQGHAVGVTCRARPR